jgi:predicted ATPase with chaperone activity
VLAKVLSSAVIGIDAFLVEVEVDITSGLPTFTTVGLPEASVKESKERVKSATILVTPSLTIELPSILHQLTSKKKGQVSICPSL